MKKLIALLLSLVLVLSLSACVTSNTLPEDQLPDQSQGGQDVDKVQFTVLVIHADGSEKTFTYETSEEFVGPVLQAAGLIKGNMGQYGMEITEVDGEKAVYAENGAYWAVYEGEEYAMQGIDTTPVVAGRTYKLVYTKG